MYKLFMIIAAMMIIVLAVCGIRLLIDRIVALHYERQYREYLAECIEKQKEGATQ